MLCLFLFYLKPDGQMATIIFTFGTAIMISTIVCYEIFNKQFEWEFVQYEKAHQRFLETFDGFLYTKKDGFSWEDIPLRGSKFNIEKIQNTLS